MVLRIRNETQIVPAGKSGSWMGEVVGWSGNGIEWDGVEMR